MKKLTVMMTGVLSMAVGVLMAADYTVSGNFVTIPVKDVKAGGAKVVLILGR